VITLQKFIAELRMLQTRAKELGLPITTNMLGRAIEACEGERNGDFLTVRRIEGLEVGNSSHAKRTRLSLNHMPEQPRQKPPPRERHGSEEQNGHEGK
jgi:hypothetical protein